MRKKISKSMFKSIAANVINVLLIMAVIFLIRKLPAKAQAVKELENQKVLAQENIDLEVLNADLLRNQDKIGQLDSLFASDKQILDVIESLSALKNSGQIQEFNIADNPIKNSSGEIGLPIFIKGTGGIDTVNRALTSFHSMGKIVKPVKFNLRVGEELAFEYTGFLLMQ